MSFDVFTNHHVDNTILYNLFGHDNIKNVLINIDSIIDIITLNFINSFKNSMNSTSKINDLLNPKINSLFVLMAILKCANIVENRNYIKHINKLAIFMQKIRINSSFVKLIKKLINTRSIKRYYIDVFIFQYCVIKASIGIEQGNTSLDIINFHKSIATKLQVSSFLICKKMIHYPQNLSIFINLYINHIKQKSNNELNKLINKRNAIYEMSDIMPLIQSFCPKININFYESFGIFLQYFSKLFKYVCISNSPSHYVIHCNNTIHNIFIIESENVQNLCECIYIHHINACNVFVNNVDNMNFANFHIILSRFSLIFNIIFNITYDIEYNVYNSLICNIVENIVFTKDFLQKILSNYQSIIIWNNSIKNISMMMNIIESQFDYYLYQNNDIKSNSEIYKTFDDIINNNLSFSIGILNLNNNINYYENVLRSFLKKSINSVSILENVLSKIFAKYIVQNNYIDEIMNVYTTDFTKFDEIFIKKHGSKIFNDIYLIHNNFSYY